LSVFRPCEAFGQEAGYGKIKVHREQIAIALKQGETGIPVAEVIRRMGISEQTFCRWKKCTAVSALASCGVRNSSRIRTDS
jgi:hypothetical protein